MAIRIGKSHLTLIKKLRQPNKDPECSKRLCDEGLCFRCKSKEHLLKDCPHRLNKHPPIRLAAAELVSLAEAHLAVVEEGNKLGLFSALFKPSTKSR